MWQGEGVISALHLMTYPCHPFEYSLHISLNFFVVLFRSRSMPNVSYFPIPYSREQVMMVITFVLVDFMIMKASAYAYDRIKKKIEQKMPKTGAHQQIRV
jgi:hypothetical protein